MEAKNEKPLVSIIIAAYNCGGFVHRAIESCLNQTYENIEIVVANDRSKDNTEEVAMRYAQKDKRVKYFLNETNQGMAGNWLRLFTLAKGDYIQRLDHDDWLSRNYIEEVVKTMNANPEAAYVVSRAIGVRGVSPDKFVYVGESNFGNKRYKTSHVLKNIDIFGNFFGLTRREDALGTESYMRGILKDPYYGEICNSGFSPDPLIPLQFVSKYDYIVYTDKPAYMKVVDVGNTGEKHGFDFNDPADIVRYYGTLYKLFEYAYSRFFSQYIYYLRVRFVGATAVGAILVNWIKNNLSLSYVKKFRQARYFFKSYSWREKCIIIIRGIYLLTGRVFSFILRKLKPYKGFVDGRDCFLNPNGEFKV